MEWFYLKSGVFLGFVVYRKNRPGVMRHMTSDRVTWAVPVVGALWSLACVRSTG